MACNHNCSGSCNSCGYGTLNCVAGPLTHCGSCAADSQYYQNFPFYSGPCGSVNCTGCGCSKLRRYHWGCGWGCSGWNHSGWNGNDWNGSGWSGHGWNNCCCSAPVSECASRLSSTSSHFYAEAPMIVGAGGAIPLSPSVVNQNCFHCTDNGILIRRPGTYMVVYSMHVPAMQSVSTRMYLCLNGNILEDSIQDIATATDGTTGIATAHMIFHALPNSLLKLVSTEEFNVNCTGDAPHLFRLTLTQM